MRGGDIDKKPNKHVADKPSARTTFRLCNKDKSKSDCLERAQKELFLKHEISGASKTSDGGTSQTTACDL